MNRILFILILILGSPAVFADARSLMEKDKSSCSAEASRAFNWVIHMSAWRKEYNQCLKAHLRNLQPRYLSASTELLRLEHECDPMLLGNDAPVEISLLGIQIVTQLTDREMEKQVTSSNIESTLELYYDRTLEAQRRVQRLRQIKNR